MSWLYLAIVLAITHGLLNWWSVNDVSDGFWVMEGSSLTPVERLAEVLTLLLNLPSLVVCYFFGFPAVRIHHAGCRDRQQLLVRTGNLLVRDVENFGLIGPGQP